MGACIPKRFRHAGPKMMPTAREHSDRIMANLFQHLFDTVLQLTLLHEPICRHPPSRWELGEMPTSPSR